MVRERAVSGYGYTDDRETAPAPLVDTRTKEEKIMAEWSRNQRRVYKKLLNKGKSEIEAFRAADFYEDDQ